MTITQNLQRHYEFLMEQENPWEFFKSLRDYLTCVFDDQILKKTFETYVAERDEKYAEVDKMEERALKETYKIRDELLALIKKRNILPSSLKHYATHSFPDSSLLDDLKKAEKNSAGERFLSGVIKPYLFDMAANIRDHGYVNDVTKFVATPREYSLYYQRINGPDLLFVEKKSGTFLFSETLPKRYEASNQLNVERELKSWGAFEMLLRFKTASEVIFNKVDRDSLFTKNTLKNVEDAVEILFVQQELQILLDRYSNGPDRPRIAYVPANDDKFNHLRRDIYIPHVKKVHFHLMGVTEPELDGKTKRKRNRTDLYLDSSGDLWRNPREKFCYEIGEHTDRYKIVRTVVDNEPQYQKTHDISLAVEKPEQLVRKEIQKINQNAKRQLKLGKDKVIEGKKGKGYRISPNYKIKLST